MRRKDSVSMSKRIPTDRTCSRIPALLCGLLMITTLSAQIGCRSEEAIGSDLPTVIGGASATTAESSVTIDSDPIDSRHSDATRSEPAPSAEPPTVESSPGSVVELDGGVRAWVGQGRVEFPGMVSLDQGWLEVAVCRRGTREHESIVVTDAIPSVVHAAMLLAGLESGAPASFDEETHRPIPPTGMRVSIELRFGAIDPESRSCFHSPRRSRMPASWCRRSGSSRVLWCAPILLRWARASTTRRTSPAPWSA